MWTREIFGTDVYHLVSAFIIYSMLGWLVESICKEPVLPDLWIWGGDWLSGFTAAANGFNFAVCDRGCNGYSL